MPTAEPLTAATMGVADKESGQLFTREVTIAADVSFATMFGTVLSFAPVIIIEALEDPANGVVLPRHSLDALSSHGGTAA